MEATTEAELDESNEFILNGEWYCDDSATEEEKEEETQNSQENTSENNNSVIEEEQEEGEMQVENQEKQINVNEKEQGRSNEEKKIIERDLGHFLRVDRRHDIWNQIQATKAEIKELEASMREMKRKRQEDQNQ